MLEATLALPAAGRWQVVDALLGAIDEAEEERLDREWGEANPYRRRGSYESGARLLEGSGSG